MKNIDRDYIAPSICQYLNILNSGRDFPKIFPDMIISVRIQDDTTIRCLVDCKIKGVPIFKIPYEELEFNPIIEVEILPAPEIVEKKSTPKNGRRKRATK